MSGAALAPLLSGAALAPLLFAAALAPLGWVGWLAGNNLLGANPIEALVRKTGWWALVFLLITLCLTPLRRLSGKSGFIRYRRMAGLFAFFYAMVHLTAYVAVDQFFAWKFIWKDIVKHPFITLGMTAFVLQVPLAVTSTRGWIKRLGKKWALLHRLVYVAAVLGVTHYFWMVKADVRGPLAFAIMLALLLGLRYKPRRKLPPLQPQPATRSL